MSCDDDWWVDVFNSDSSVAQAIIRSLTWDHGVKLLAFDFDLTLVNVNTGGKWKKSPEKLAKHVRPCFRELIKAALKNGGVRVSIVTFSIQPALISETLKHLLPNCNTSSIIIEANDKHIRPQLSPEVYRVGKQKHIKKVLERINNQYGINIQPHQVLLFDDRSRYIHIAKENGHLAFEVNNNVTLDCIREFVDNLSKPDSSTAPNIPAQATKRMVSVLAVSSWPPKHIDKGTEGWAGPLNVIDFGASYDADDAALGKGAVTSLDLKNYKEIENGLNLGTSFVAVRYDS